MKKIFYILLFAPFCVDALAQSMVPKAPKLNLDSCTKLYFICRSGSRSLYAAYSVQTLVNQQQNIKNTIKCINVKFGFEGDLSEDKRRGFSNGWKFSGLPWKQS